jgi:parallel beta-helix repeat protein
LVKKGLVILLLVLLAPAALAISRTCTRVLDPPRVDQSTRLCADNYYPHNYPQGIKIAADNIVLDCGTAVLHGSFKNAGIVIENRKQVTIKNCQVANYDIGILVKNSRDITILNANLIRNYFGIKLVDSSSVVVEDSFDISLKKPVQLINAVGNTFHYNNKRMEGEQCRLNQCNTPTGLAVQEHSLAKAEEPKKALRRMLNDNIRAWIMSTL